MWTAVAAPTTLTVDEEGRGGLEERIAFTDQRGDGLRRHHCTLALVEDPGDLVDGLDLALDRDLLVQHDALLAMHHHAGVVRAKFRHCRLSAGGRETADHDEGGQHLLLDTGGIFGGVLEFGSNGIFCTRTNADRVEQATVFVP